MHSYASPTKASLRHNGTRPVRSPSSSKIKTASAETRVPRSAVRGILKTSLEKLDQGPVTGLVSPALSQLGGDGDGLVGTESLFRWWLKNVLPALERAPREVMTQPAAYPKLHQLIGELLQDKLSNIMLQQVASLCFSLASFHVAAAPAFTRVSLSSPRRQTSLLHTHLPYFRSTHQLIVSSPRTFAAAPRS